MTKTVDAQDLTALLNAHPALKCIESGRVKCTITNHEMLCRKDVVIQHVNGKKYKRLTKDIYQEFSFTQYEPHLIPSNKKGYENQLFCLLTLRHVNKIPQHVERHVSGRKYLKAKIRWEECQKNGTKFHPTPLQNRPSKAIDDEEDHKKVAGDDGDSDADSFSDLYPEKYFESLRLDSEDEVKMEVTKKKKPKKKKSIKKTSERCSQEKTCNVKKRKAVSEDKLTNKKQRIVNPTTKKMKEKATVLTFGV